MDQDQCVVNSVPISCVIQVVVGHSSTVQDAVVMMHSTDPEVHSLVTFGEVTCAGDVHSISYMHCGATLYPECDSLN